MLPDQSRLFASAALVTFFASSVARAQDAAPPPPAEPLPPAQEAPAAPAVNFNLFADTYVSYNSSETGSPPPYHRAYDNKTPYDPVTQFPDGGGFGNRSLFGLSFVGLDASFDTGVVGATAFLRFGPSVPIFYGTDGGPAGIDSILGGYITVKPTEALTLDAGYFGTIYGAEVAESWINLNYTRGGLYYAMQPFYHFGIKANYAINDMVALRAMVVNGANNIADENDAPAFGLQLALNDLGGVFDLFAGGFYESGSDSFWGIETFVDVVGILTLGDVTVIGNFDYNINRGDDEADPATEDVSYWGAMATVGYAITPEVGVAVRGEYLADPDGVVFLPLEGGDATEDSNVVTLTGTLDLKLVPHLVLRPEFRYEMAGREIFADGDGAPTDTWFTGVIGLVAHTH